MKRIFLVAVVCLLFIALCGSFALSEEADPLLEQAKALAAHLGELTKSDEYVKALSGSEMLNELIRDWRGDYSAPSKAVCVTLEAGADSLFLKNTVSEEVEWPEEVAADLFRRTFAGLPLTLNSTQGVETLAAASVLTTETAFVCDACDAPALYILTFKSGMPVAVTFIPYSDGAVTATATFLASDAETWLSTFEPLRALGLCNIEEIAF